MKLISWNVNGLRACEGKGFSDIFKQLDADFFCLQETKMQEGQLDLKFDGYESYWNYAEKKGYSGTAIFTKHKAAERKLRTRNRGARPRRTRNNSRDGRFLHDNRIYAKLSGRTEEA